MLGGMDPVTSPEPPGPITIPDVIERLDRTGWVELPGCETPATRRWQRHRRVAMTWMLGTGAFGVVLFVTGLVLREAGLWSPLILFGGFLAFMGTCAAGLLGIAGALMAERVRSERLPVRIDANGIALRGIGPLPWTFLAPPQRLHIPSRNDIGGECIVMPLTPAGHAFVNTGMGMLANRVGPKPYLRPAIPYLLLPGVCALGDDDVAHLVATAQQRWSGQTPR